MKNGCLFWLLAGALLQDTVNFDNELLCSNANITDDLALYHLKTNPKCRQYFEVLPDNVDELIEAYQLPGEELKVSLKENDTENVQDDAEAEEDDEQDNIISQEEAEEIVISQIAEMLKVKTTKTAIKEHFKEVSTVGIKNLTQRFLVELIDRAETVISEETKTV